MNTAINLELQATLKSKGNVIRKPGSRNLYVSFRYFGRRIEKSTGLLDNTKNRKRVEQWLTRVMERIEEGTFKFVEAFPGASEGEKATFARLEGWEYNPEPKDVVFGEYVASWLTKVWANFDEGSNKETYKRVLESRLLPYFKGHTFNQITSVELKAFIGTLKKKKGNGPLAKSTYENILIPLRVIWNDACEEYRWSLHNPFNSARKSLPKTPPIRREVFRFDEWIKLLEDLDDWYKPIMELMLLTGLRNSELAGIRRSDVDEKYISIQNSIVKGHEKSTLKTGASFRRIPITRAIRKRLDVLLSRTTGRLIVTTETGAPFHGSNFLNRFWYKAIEKSGVRGKTPYCLRHSFTAWSNLLGIDINRLEYLMGHSSKEMIYRTYGKYVEGLEEDYWKIREYFGEDFISGKEKAPENAKLGESLAKVWSFKI